VRRRGESRQREQQAFFRRRNLVAVDNEDEERQHGQPGEDVGEEGACKPWQRGGQDQHQADCQQPQRLRHAEHAQRQMQDPQCGQRLNAEIDPET
jgi:hypothetical protein